MEVKLQTRLTLCVPHRKKKIRRLVLLRAVSSHSSVDDFVNDLRSRGWRPYSLTPTLPVYRRCTACHSPGCRKDFAHRQWGRESTRRCKGCTAQQRLRQCADRAKAAEAQHATFTPPLPQPVPAAVSSVPLPSATSFVPPSPRPREVAVADVGSAHGTAVPQAGCHRREFLARLGSLFTRGCSAWWRAGYRQQRLKYKVLLWLRQHSWSPYKRDEYMGEVCFSQRSGGMLARELPTKLKVRSGSGCVKTYAAPNYCARPHRTLQNGTVITVTEQIKGWLRFESATCRGWVRFETRAQYNPNWGPYGKGLMADFIHY